jgi:plasmid stability protein
MATTIVTLPCDLHQQLKALAAAEHRSVNATVIVAVTEYLRTRDKRSAVTAMAAVIADQDRPIIDRLA